MRRSVVVVLLLGVTAAPAGAKIRDGVRLARYEENGRSAEVTAARTLADGRARIDVTTSQRPRTVNGRVVVMGTLHDAGQQPVRGRRAMRARFTDLTCAIGRAVLVGTVTPRVARVEVVFGDGRTRRLRRRPPPPGWNYDGRVVASFLRVTGSPFELRALDARGKVLERRRFDPPAHECD